MKNSTQLDRYKKLIEFIEAKFKEDLSVEDIEDISFYSYRNINRIFEALHNETIGQYIKRIKLEKAAEYLKFSTNNITEIACDVGYSDIAAFSKAFKKHFNCSPSAFRSSHELNKRYITRSTISIPEEPHSAFSFDVEEIPDLEVVYLTFQGTYDNIYGIKDTWRQLIDYALKYDLLHEDSIVLGEVLDDNEITETINCRYNAAIVLEKPIDFSLGGLFKVKRIQKQKYAKFVHKGSHESCQDTYNEIYGHWMTQVQLEFEDKPTLEFYLNDTDSTPEEDLLTEIYIPVK
ncbi:AraC family transcriptional regulator [Fulvivirga sp. M361]|uniref:AraC family transcriptional regulator n=1 Tax=Fulvivirga sp. M361 TaxID=2594266 RepID=UPI00117AD836|nr:AraC family transcriptional regulator [Fulvivirga sp. M361]TRX57727.1 AraC family transcriptional regulator [Fulvivirga sp. M361]